MNNTDYASKTGSYFEEKREEMLPYIPLSAKRILEVGCGNAAFAANLKSKRPVRVVGIEAHPAAAETARPRLDRLICASIEEALPQLGDEKFDCIVLNDVLEHLVDPWEVLKSLRPYLESTGTVVASIPNVRYMPVFKEYLLQGLWTYRSNGVMDRTHLRFFTRHSMNDLFSTTGYIVQRLEGINSIPLPWKFSLLNALMGQSLDDTRFRQFACVASPPLA